jgi:hypothetical protein
MEWNMTRIETTARRSRAPLSRRLRRVVVALAGVVVMAGTVGPVAARYDQTAAIEALAPFETLVGGRWAMDDSFHHTFEGVSASCR